MSQTEKQEMPSGREGQCTSRTKTCRECGHRFSKGDKSWYCEECGEPRRCTNNAVTGRPTCRVHGGTGGRPPSLKYRVANQLSPAFATAFNHDDLLELNQEIAIMGARQDSLMERLENVDVSGVHSKILAAAEKIETGIIAGNTTVTAEGLTELRRALNPIQIEESIWYQIKDNFEVQRRLVDTQRRWASTEDQTMPIGLVLELITLIQRISFRYIPSHRDRAECAEEIRSYLPSGKSV